MQQRYTLWLIPILLIVLAAIYIVLAGTGTPLATFGRQLAVRLGLDLEGGLQVLLEADLPAGATVEQQSMEVARQIIEQRVNGLGLTEPVVQLQGDRRIVVELPGVTDSQQAIATIQQTGLLEFVYGGPAGSATLLEGDTIRTDCVDPSQVDCGNPTGTAPLPTAPLTDTTAGSVYHTVMTGVALRTATAGADPTTGEIIVDFELTEDGNRIFSAFTSQHVGEILAIVLDKRVISAPRINQAITEGRGTISGSFNQESANQLALQLRYGSLPVPLIVAQSREVGPTLGQDSVRQSTIAGVVGLTVVALFMILYYRLPGMIAVIALLIYAVVTFALFILLPVTLTLPGIAGFVLSVGVAVDANILIFERMKEELRGGKTLHNAVDAGFSRAWPSIRDSNISTLITCVILYWFGNTFGASIVKGFALTLALGVGVSLFTAILVTRSILHLFLDRIDFSARHSWFGI